MKNKIVNHFYVKESKKDSNEEAPIYLRITVNGERAEISTNRRINPANWDKASERVAGRSESARIINSTLNNILGKVEKQFSGLDAQDKLFQHPHYFQLYFLMLYIYFLYLRPNFPFYEQ